MLRDINDEIFEGDGDGLEEEELERVVYHPFLDHEVTGEVEKSREEERDIELGVGRSTRTARELQKLVCNKLSQPRELLINMRLHDRKKERMLVLVAFVGATFA